MTHSNLTDSPPQQGRRQPGVCAMRGECGKKGMFGQVLPCADDGDAEPVDDEMQRLLADVCGPTWTIPSSTCCTSTQLHTLRSSLQQAEPLISSCPACRNNFRSFYCSFTCSPDQSLFLSVDSVQSTDTSDKAVKQVSYYVEESFKKGFYDSCKDVTFGATNGFAMDLIGGGAKSGQKFLEYMGDLRPGLGSPFKIEFPLTGNVDDVVVALEDGVELGDDQETTFQSNSTTSLARFWSLPDGIQPLPSTPLNCYDTSLTSRCTCIDCPSICPSLPYLSPPRPPNTPKCTVGQVSCLTFSLLIIYSVGIILGLSVWSWKLGVRRRKRKYQRMALLSGGDGNGDYSDALEGNGNGHGSAPLESPATSHHPHQQRTSDTMTSFPDPSTHSGSSRYRLGRGASLLDPNELGLTVGSASGMTGRKKLNSFLREKFYLLGWKCATRPALTFSIALMIVAGLNIGWKWFEIETDPVKLWVSPTSEAAREKGFFDETFGPFYRPQQVFVMGIPGIREGTQLGRHEEVEDGDVTIMGLPKASPVMDYDTLNWWLKHEEEISLLRSEPNNYTLQDVCFAPGGPGTPCVVQSVSAWFGTDMSEWDKQPEGWSYWKDRLNQCASTPSECLPDFGQPIDSKFVLGGLDKEEEWLSAKSLVITWVVGDSLDVNVKAKAEEWERTLRGYLMDLESRSEDEAGVKIAYSTGVSLEEELNKSTNTDVKIVVASYLVMFLYISLTLGGGINMDFFFGRHGIFSGIGDAFNRLAIMLHLKTAKPPKTSAASFSSPSRKRRYMASLLPTLVSVNSKFMLGLFGIVIVLIAVSSSVGFFSLLGVKVTLIIAEVIPFLVLAVGVDNVFILVHELDRQNGLHGPSVSTSHREATATASGGYEDSIDAEVPGPMHLSVEERVARALARMGPSILLSSTTEVVAFALGALVPMPAVRNFALYAAGSVFLGAVLQVTVFISAMTLDLKRVESTRVDCFPCIRLQPPIGLYDVTPTVSTEGLVERFIRKYYAPFLLKKPVKQLVIMIFGGIFITSIVGIQKITMGLDQRLALPSDSYLVDYFDALDAYLQIGPPVYFVTEDVDITQRSGQQQLCGRFTTCMDLSVVNSLEAERKRPESSFLANPPAPWIDDFLHWTDPILETCCRVRKADPSVFCSARDPERLCRPCFQDLDPAWDITMQGLPEGTDTMQYLKQWLKSPTNEECPLGGQAAYSSAVAFSKDNSTVKASHFRTFHSPLKTQEDFINALAAARRISADISERTGVKVFPYSLFYVFFEQYAHIISMTTQVLMLALFAILTITSLLLGSWRTGFTVTLTCLLSVLGVMGLMGFWHVSLNAISLVNLVISLGIAVEFCAHLARGFMGSTPSSGNFDPDGNATDLETTDGFGEMSEAETGSNGMGMGMGRTAVKGGQKGEKERDVRAMQALIDVGPSVFSGITMTKLIGISVLALTRSKLLEVYYFRMWLSLILSSALHGLILLPVLLSYIGGGPGYSLEESDEDWVTSAMRRPEVYEYAPFGRGDEGSDEDSD